MVEQSPRFGLNTGYEQGEDNWSHNDTVDFLDEIAEERGPIADRPDTGTYDNEVYFATDEDLYYRWDATNSEWVAVAGKGSESSPLPGTAHREAISTGQLGNARLVGPGGFSTLQAAHDDLPETGGLIIMTGGTQETGTVLDKPMKVIGPRHRSPTWATSGHDDKIDTSGGDGIWIKEAVEFHSVAIDGGGGDYDLQVGTHGTPGLAGVIMDEVSVRNAGSDNVQLRGPMQSCTFKFRALNDAGRHNLHIDITGEGDYFNANLVELPGCSGAAEDGLHLTSGGNGEVQGNRFANLVLEGNVGTAFHVDDATEFGGNEITGYGAEGNGKSFALDNLQGTGGNVLRVRTGFDYDISRALFDEFQIAAVPNTVGVMAPALDNYLFDDWRDGRLSNRAGSQVGQFTDPHVGPIGTFQGVRRPEWEISTGSPTAEAGQLVLPAEGAETARVRKDGFGWPYGRVEFTLNFDASSTSGDLIFRWNQDINEGGGFYQARVDSTGVTVQKNDDGYGTLIDDASYPNDSDSHTVAVERDGSDEWAVYVDGEQSGSSATEAFLPADPTRLEFVNQMDVPVHVEEIRFC